MNSPTLETEYPFYLANEAKKPNTDLEIRDKYTGDVAARVAQAGKSDIEEAIAKASEAASEMRSFRPYQRQKALQHCIERFQERAEELALALCIEAGKPIKDSHGEVSRLIDTFKIAAEESTRINGETLNLEISERSKGYRGSTQRVPVGLCSFITPFNFPLNLVAHKVAPAIAAGCPFVLKPSQRTPLGALIIGEILAETDLPKGAFSILTSPSKESAAFSVDERIKFLSFTGSPKVGWELKSKAGKKKVTLELGGNAACIVDEGTQIDDAVKRIVFGAFYQSGQSCVSVQRIIAHESVYDELKRRLVSAARDLRSGNPRDEKTFIGPMISESEAERVESWIRSAREKGAKLLCGGKRSGAILEATLLQDVPKDEPLYRKEAFGPVAILSRYSNFPDAINEANDSAYGIHAGVFTQSLDRALFAWDNLEVGGVIVNDVPSWRVDHMPYGGVKSSGIGREGVRYAIEEMTEIRLLAIRQVS